MKIAPTSRFAPKANVHARRFDDDMVVLDLEHGLYFSLDEVGAAMWEGFAQGQSLQEISVSLAVRYDVSEERLLADGEALVKRLLDADLVAVRPDREP